jgi:hypothetical protein
VISAILFREMVKGKKRAWSSNNEIGLGKKTKMGNYSFGEEASCLLSLIGDSD